MARHEEEISDIVVVLEESVTHKIEELVLTIKSAGVCVESIDNDNGVIEGTVPSGKLKSIQAIPGVKYVRDVFNYLAEECDEGDTDEHLPR
jgi:hypothetical protein